MKYQYEATAYRMPADNSSVEQFHVELNKWIPIAIYGPNERASRAELSEIFLDIEELLELHVDQPEAIAFLTNVVF